MTEELAGKGTRLLSSAGFSSRLNTRRTASKTFISKMRLPDDTIYDNVGRPGQQSKGERLGRAANPWPLIGAAALALIAGYLIFGHSWPPYVWAFFCVFAIAIVVNEAYVRLAPSYGATYEKVRLVIGGGLVIAVIVGGVLNASWWILLVGAALVYFWVGDFRRMRRRDQTE